MLRRLRILWKLWQVWNRRNTYSLAKLVASLQLDEGIEVTDEQIEHRLDQLLGLYATTPTRQTVFRS